MRQTAPSCPVATTRLCENIASESPVISSIPAALGKDSLLSWVNRPEGIHCAPSHHTALTLVKLLRAPSESFRRWRECERLGSLQPPQTDGELN